jgi:2',3'-cyclic-nucleotide 2'-phosphodiesterase (5'-nucleotidase family)
MVNLKNYKVLFQYFGLFLTFALLFSCAPSKNVVTKVEGKLLKVDNTISANKEIDNYVKPFRDKIDEDLNTVLAFAPETLDKSGLWQSKIGNLLSDITMMKGNLVFNKRENKIIDVCLLNHGGIRAIINKGNVTARTAFEVMPFENRMIVVSLKSEQIIELINYFVATKKPHPLSGLTFTIEKNQTPTNILIQGKPIEKDKIYNVVTSDYLSNGGDSMDFFKKGVAFYDLDYKLRNVLIDYFKDVDVIPVVNDVRIRVE